MILQISKERELIKIKHKLMAKSNVVVLRTTPFAKKKLEIKHPLDTAKNFTLDEVSLFEVLTQIPKVKQMLDDVKKGNADNASYSKRQIKKVTKKVAKEVKKALKNSDKRAYRDFNTKVYMLINMTAYNNKKHAMFVLYNEKNEVSNIAEAAFKVIFKYFEVETYKFKSKEIKKLFKVKGRKQKKAVKKLAAGYSVGEEGENRLQKIEKKIFPLIMNAEFFRTIALGKDPAGTCTKKYMKKFFDSLSKKDAKKLAKTYKKFRRAMKATSLDLPRKLEKLRDAEGAIFVRYYLGTKDRSVDSPDAMVEFMKPIVGKYKNLSESVNKAIIASNL